MVLQQCVKIVDILGGAAPKEKHGCVSWGKLGCVEGAVLDLHGERTWRGVSDTLVWPMCDLEKPKHGPPCAGLAGEG